MILLAVIAALLVGLWAFSRFAVLLIERRHPPIGRIVKVGDLDVHVLDVPGGAGAPVLLLIHGASGNLREPVAALEEALGGRYRLIAIDRPGHGYTSRGEPEMSDPARQADLLAATLERLGVKSCLALGHSWGGAVAAALAVRHPECVEGLVLMAPASHPWPGGVPVRTRFFSLPFVGRIAADLVVVPIGLLIAPLTIGAIFDPDPVPAGFSARIGALLAIRPGTFVSSARDVVDFHDCLVRLSPHYNEIAVPTEIVTGEMDLVVSPAIHAYGLARDIPGARLTVMPGVGHLPQWSRTSDVVAAIERTRARMAKVRRLGRSVHIEDAHVRERFGIEDAPGKLNGDRAL